MRFAKPSSHAKITEYREDTMTQRRELLCSITLVVKYIIETAAPSSHQTGDEANEDKVLSILERDK